MSAEDLEEYESDVELQLYREYKDVCPMFRFVVETERRFYLANEVNQSVVNENGRSRVEIEHVQAEPIRFSRPSGHIQRRQHRRVATRRAATPVKAQRC